MTLKVENGFCDKACQKLFYRPHCGSIVQRKPTKFGQDKIV